MAKKYTVLAFHDENQLHFQIVKGEQKRLIGSGEIPVIFEGEKYWVREGYYETRDSNNIQIYNRFRRTLDYQLNRDKDFTLWSLDMKKPFP